MTITQEHYFHPEPSGVSDYRSITVQARGVAASVRSDNGVFSKRGLDFGSRLLIETVVLPATGVAVDLGCGYGVVAAILSRVYPQLTWWALDVNRRAVELTRHNLAHAAERTVVLPSDGFAAAPPGSVDAVLLNPPIRSGKATIYRLFEESLNRLLPHGCLWIVMRKQQGAQSAKRWLEAREVLVDERDRQAGYCVFACTMNRVK